MSHGRIPMSIESSVTEWVELRAMGVDHERACNRIGIPVKAMERRVQRARERGEI